MSPSDLKFHVDQTGSKFFTPDSMKFFGDKMSNYGVSAKPVTVTTSTRTVECWELYRKRPVKHGLQKPAYFSVETFERVLPAITWSQS
jgi:hypothetical protein